MNDELRYVKMDKDFGDIERIEEIYNTSFPPEERFFTVRGIMQNIEIFVGIELTAVYDKDVLIGFCVVSVYRQLNYKYLEFIAVDTTIRGKGYGGRILKKLLDDNKDMVFFGSIEKPIPNSKNYEIATRRQHFYERNGMITVDRERIVNGVPFIIVTNKTGEEFDRSYENEMKEEKRLIEESRKIDG